MALVVWMGRAEHTQGERRGSWPQHRAAVLPCSVHQSCLFFPFFFFPAEEVAGFLISTSPSAVRSAGNLRDLPKFPCGVWD